MTDNLQSVLAELASKLGTSAVYILADAIVLAACLKRADWHNDNAWAAGVIVSSVLGGPAVIFLLVEAPRMLATIMVPEAGTAAWLIGRLGR